MIYKHIVWDWNGTLLNDAEACSSSVNQMLKKRNMGSLTLEEYRDRIVFPVINLYYEAGFDMEKESFKILCDEYINSYIAMASVINIQDDALNVLKGFAKIGLTQHIVSASGFEILMKQIKYYNLSQYFTNILGQKDNQAESKVHLAKNLIERTNCNPREVLFIGDTIHDAEVSKEVGFDCFLVSNGHCSEWRLKDTGYPVFENLTSLYQSILIAR